MKGVGTGNEGGVGKGTGCGGRHAQRAASDSTFRERWHSMTPHTCDTCHASIFLVRLSNVGNGQRQSLPKSMECVGGLACSRVRRAAAV